MSGSMSLFYSYFHKVRHIDTPLRHTDKRTRKESFTFESSIDQLSDQHYSLSKNI